MASSYFKLKILGRIREARKRKSLHEEKSMNSNDNTSGSQKCRICLKEGNIPIYGDGTAPDVSEYVKTFGDIQITEEDEFPKHLCEACHSLLQNAVLFRKAAKETDEFLHEKVVTVSQPVQYYDGDFNNHRLVPYLANNNAGTPTNYNCKLCKLKFRTAEEYRRHKVSKRHKNVRVQCPICNGLLTPQLYKRHLMRHQSASHLICEVCGKMFRKDNLARHLQLHSFVLPFQCQICPYRGRFMESLKIHLRTHTGDRPFSCDKCQLRFLTRSNLNRHLLTHKKDRPHKCIECGRGFYLKRDLDIHFKTDHAGIKDFGCRICGNKYGTRKALMRHELRVHKRDKMAKGRVPLYLQAEYRKASDEASLSNA